MVQGRGVLEDIAGRWCQAPDLKGAARVEKSTADGQYPLLPPLLTLLWVMAEEEEGQME